MKTITFAILIALFSFCPVLHSQESNQYPLFDAVQYNDYLKSGNFSDARAILEKYQLDTLKKEPLGSDSLGRFNSIIGTRFITIPDSINMFATSNLVVGNSQSEDKSIGIGASAMIDELAKIIADRFREELTLAFLDNFRQKLKADSSLSELFPNAKRVLLYDDPFSYDSWLASFRTALDTDVKELPEHLPALLKGISEIKGIALDQDQKDFINAAIEVYEQVLPFVKSPEDSYKNTVQLLDHLSIKFKDTSKLGGLKLLAPLVKELRNAGQTDWATSALIKKLEDLKNLKVFIGFTIEKYKNELKNATITVGKKDVNVYDWAHADPAKDASVELTTSSVQSSSALTKLVRDISRSVQIIQKDVTDLENKKLDGETIVYTDFAPLLTSGFDLISLLTSDTTMKIVSGEMKLPESLTNVTKSINAVVPFLVSANESIASENYAQVLLTTMKVLETWIPDSILENNVFLKDFLKYGNLAVNLATATTPEAFASALEAAMLPAQSYRLKRNSFFSFSVNAYAGVFGGIESLRNVEAQNRQEWMGGFTAPIGIGANWGLTQKNQSKFSKTPAKTIVNNGIIAVERRRYFTGHSLSLYASIIDIGAVVAFRLKDDESPTAKVQWKNVLSPGLYVIWGIGNTPLALNIGAQYGPELRSVTATDEATAEAGVPELVVDSKAWRFGAALTVDIPLFNLYSKSEKVKEVSMDQVAWDKKYAAEEDDKKKEKIEKAEKLDRKAKKLNKKLEKIQEQKAKLEEK